MNIEKLIRLNIKALQPYSSARDEYKDATSKMVFLDANENPFANGVNRYPDPYQTNLKAEISNLKGISVENMLLGNGSDEVLDLIVRVFCEPNQDNIITLPPTYGMYEVLANVNAIEVIKVNLSESFQPQVSQILEAANSNSKILFLCSPNNPTANSLENGLVEKLLNEFKGIVVIDEAYIDFSQSESWLSRLSNFPNLIVTQTLSKAYGMAGIRLGICYASKEIISVLNKVKPPYNVNSLSQKMALTQILKNDLVEEQINVLKSQRAILKEALKVLNFVKTIYPSDTNFLLLEVDDANKRYNQLIELSVVVRNRTNQPLCENCIRITIGTPKENETLIKTLKTLE